MSCYYCKKKGSKFYCESPRYSGGNNSKDVTTLASVYCNGNYKNCPDYSYTNSNNDDLRRDRERIKNQTLFPAMVIGVIIGILLLSSLIKFIFNI